MRLISLIAVLLLYAGVLFAQKDIPTFGKIDKAEFTSLECPYDPDAEAEMLLNYASMQYLVNAGVVSTQVEYRVRVKILKEKGVSRGNISIPFYNHLGRVEKISKIEAYTYNPDASGNPVATKLDKTTIYEKPIDKRWSEIVFSMPAVKVGSIIEYRFLDYSSGFSIDSWYFQDDIPTRISAYEVQFPVFLKLEEKYYAYQKVEKDSYRKADDIFKSYVMRNVPAVRLEPYTSSLKDYRQKMDFAAVAVEAPGQPYMSIRVNWKDIGADLLEDEDFGTTLHRNLNLPPLVEKRVKSAGTDYEKMLAVYNHVRQTMNWNKRYSIWAMDGIKKCWEEKAGNSGEINLVLINLLRAAKLPVYPIMVSTRNNGRINLMFPSEQHFNSVMAYVEIDSNYYILDATDRSTPPQLVPQNVVNTEGLVLVSNGKIQWLTLTPGKQRYRQTVTVSAEVNADGHIIGQAKINSFDYSRIKRLQVLNTDRNQFLETFYAHVAPGIRIDSFRVNNELNDSLPLEQRVDFHLPMVNSGEYKYFSPNLFLGLENNEFIAEKRKTDIDFGYNQSYALVGNFRLPDDYEIEELPGNKRLVLPDKSITLFRASEMVDHQLNIRILLDFTQPVYGIDNYEDFRVFYKLLFDTLNEQIVIHKKKT